MPSSYGPIFLRSSYNYEIRNTSISNLNLQVSQIYALTFTLFFRVITLYANSTPIVALTLSYVPFTYLLCYYELQIRLPKKKI